MVDHDDLPDVLDAGETFDRARLLFHGLAAFAQQVAVEKAVDQGRFSRTGNTGHAGENTERKIGIELFDVVQRRAAQFEKLFRLAAFGGNRDGTAADQVIRGERIRCIGNQPRRSAIHELAAGLALSGTDVGEPVGRADDRFLVLDDEECVSVVTQAAHDGKKLSEIARMESDARFVHDKESVDQ